MPFGIEIPDKAYFKIGEVARLIKVKPYVLRYWETEFAVLKPQKGKSGQRAYSRGDVALLAEIRHLLYDRRYTIEGARKRLRRTPEPEAAQTADGAREVLRRVRRDLEELVQLVDKA
ncbi:MAG TPA: MerR family transcriptional regulator [Polyangia bacterium]|nr:MerR family transcriptional regulator [Polyangia bacterium]